MPEEERHDVEEHGLLVREALVALQDVEHRLGHRVALAHGRHHELRVVLLGHVRGVRHGSRSRPAAEQRERDVDLVRGRGVVGVGVEGVEQQRRDGPRRGVEHAVQRLGRRLNRSAGVFLLHHPVFHAKTPKIFLYLFNRHIKPLILLFSRPKPEFLSACSLSIKTFRRNSAKNVPFGKYPRGRHRL